MNEGSAVVSELDLLRWKSKFEEKDRGKKILIIDEEFSELYISECAEIFSVGRELGYTIERASGGREGVLALFFERPKMVFMNPVFNGEVQWRLLENIKKTASKIPLVLMFERKYRAEIIDDPRSALAMGFLYKPVAGSPLKQMMSSLPNPDRPLYNPAWQ